MLKLFREFGGQKKVPAETGTSFARNMGGEEVATHKIKGGIKLMLRATIECFHHKKI